jgi:hypothetical protein
MRHVELRDIDSSDPAHRHIPGNASLAVVTLMVFSSVSLAQPVADDWVRNDRVVSMGGLYTHQAWSVDVGDVDCDGIDDMVFTTADGTVEMYRGTGLSGNEAWGRWLDWSEDIHLELPPGPGSDFAYGWFVAITNLNGNGLPEIVLTSGDWDHEPLCLERSDDEPFTWLPAQHLMTGLPGFICVAAFRDVEGDGDNDMAATQLETQWGDMSTVLFWNDGNATSPIWRRDDTYFDPWAGEWPHLSIDFDDIEGDQDNDLFLLDLGFESAICPFVYLNVGTGLDPSWERYDPPPGYWIEPVCNVEKGDLVMFDNDHDSDTDLMLLTSPMGQLFQYENHSWADSVAIDGPDMLAGPIWGWPTMSDLDWDGDHDLVVSYSGVSLYGPTTQTAEYRNDGTADDPLWETVQRFGLTGTMGPCAQMSMGDLDDDTHDDLLFLGADPGFYWRRGAATQPNWEYDPSVSAEFSNLSFATDPAFVDFDTDGLVDFTCRYQGVRRMFRNVGESGSPTLMEWPAWAEGLPNSVTAFGRLDTDPYVDAVIAGLDSTLYCYLGSPGETPPWAETELYLTGLKLPVYPGKLVLTNLDGEASNDLLTQFGSVAYYTNTGPIGAVDAPLAQTLRLRISPNPVQSGGMLELCPSLSSQLDVSLFDLSGRLVEQIWQGETRAGEILTIAPRPERRNLPGGTYIISAEACGQRKSERVVVIR